MFRNVAAGSSGTVSRTQLCTFDMSPALRMARNEVWLSGMVQKSYGFSGNLGESARIQLPRQDNGHGLGLQWQLYDLSSPHSAPPLYVEMRDQSQAQIKDDAS